MQERLDLNTEIVVMRRDAVAQSEDRAQEMRKLQSRHTMVHESLLHLQVIFVQPVLQPQ